MGKCGKSPLRGYWLYMVIFISSGRLVGLTWTLTKDTVFLVQPFITYSTNDKKTAECSNPWGNFHIADSLNQCLLGLCGEVKCDSVCF